jgi:hypothetical protein
MEEVKFCFVEMTNDDEALDRLMRCNCSGRPIVVNKSELSQKEEKKKF